MSDWLVVLIVLAAIVLLLLRLKGRRSKQGRAQYARARTAAHETALLPELGDDRELQVESFSGDGETYQVNVALLTCTCPDFQKERGEFPQRDIRRVCKHLREIIHESPKAQLPPLLRAVFEDEHMPYASSYFYRRLGDRELLIAVKPDASWVSVYAQKSQYGRKRAAPYTRFGYNIRENRWSYDKRPAESVEIKKLVRELVR